MIVVKGKDRSRMLLSVEKYCPGMIEDWYAISCMDCDNDYKRQKTQS